MKTATRAWIVLALLGAGCAGAAWVSRPGPEDEMAAAATRFLRLLSPELRARASRPFEAREREDWHYIPRTLAGVELGAMTDEQKRAARDLMRSALSSRGAGKVEEIMLLDGVLRELERGGSVRRDPQAYAIAVFGTPGPGQAWGWKLEGHHVSLNFTGVAGAGAVTPAFLGANPAEVRSGERAGVRVLAMEEDLGRRLVHSLDESQRRAAIIGAQAPGDILGVPGRSLDDVERTGLEVSAMTPEQRALVERLLEEYAGNLRHEFAAHELERIRDAGIESVRFAWMGGVERGEGHYYRLSGPTFVIEYDNTQNNANHVHTVWRDRARDFGHDLLKEHYERGHGHRE